MNVRMPDGTVVKGVPDGMPKADFVAKAKANGAWKSEWDAAPAAAPPAPESKLPPKGGLGDVGKDIAAQWGEGKAAASGGIQDVRAGNVSKGLLGIGMGGLQMAGSPASGTSQALVGDPLRRSLAEHVQAMPYDTPDQRNHRAFISIFGGAGANLAEQAAPMAVPGLPGAAKAAGRAIEPLAQAELADAQRVSALNRRELRPGIAESRAAGYVFPPRTATKDEGIAAKVAQGLGGKVKTEQEASAANQATTNALAAQGVGMGRDTHLDLDVIKQAKRETGKAWDAPAKVMPTLRPAADAQFKMEIGASGSPQASAQAKFPISAATSPRVAALVKEFARTKTMTSAEATGRVKALRSDASAHFEQAKLAKDPDVRALAKTESKIAHAIESMMERNLQNAELRLKADISSLQTERAQLLEAIDKERAVVSRRLVDQPGSQRSIVARIPDIVPGPAEALAEALKNSEAKIRQMKQRLVKIGGVRDGGGTGERLRGEVGDTIKRLREAQRLGPQAVGGMVQDIRSARQRYATLDSVERALNDTTGEVRARTIAAIVRKVGAQNVPPEFRAIANAYGAGKKVMQVPSDFGHPESLSALDAAMAGASGLAGFAGAGIPGLVASAAPGAARMGARKLMLSQPGQRLMFGQ